MDAIISIDLHQRIIVFNAAAEKIFRCPAEEAMGQPLDKFIPARFRDVHARHIRDFGRTGTTSRSMSSPGTLVGLRANGEEFPIEATISQVDSAGDKVFSVIIRDISERKRAEIEREEMLRQAEQQAALLKEQAARLETSNLELKRLAAEAALANQSKSDFLAVMSHELRTPLNAIAGYTELLELGIRGPVTHEQVADLQRIRRNEQHLLGLINEILHFAKLETGRVEYTIGPCAVEELLSTIEILVQPQLRAKELQYTYVPVACNLSLAGDGDRVQQILLNLTSNAIKFTQPGGTITVYCTVTDAAIAIHVADTGRGIPSSKLETIFEPFVQVDRRLTRQFEGIGLGLAISRDLATGMGGKLTVESTEGEGSTFTLEMPRWFPKLVVSTADGVLHRL